MVMKQKENCRYPSTENGGRWRICSMYLNWPHPAVVTDDRNVMRRKSNYAGSYAENKESKK